jgi:hypothetical protein
MVAPRGIFIVIPALLAFRVAQQDTLELVLQRTAQNLVQYYSSLSVLVAEEQYEQWIETVGQSSQALSLPAGQPTRENIGPPRRILVSDFLLMHLPGQAAWLGFRDVLLVDGQPVRDRQERLAALTTQNPKDFVAQASKIAEESARYNIGDVFRTINVPTQALDVLHADYQARFSFRRSGQESVDGNTAWKIQYTERNPPYLIRRTDGQGLRAAGIVWIDPTGGTVLKTQLEVVIAEAVQVLRTQITVDYRSDAKLGLRVPVEMQETHDLTEPQKRSGSTSRIRGRARYQNFRRFETSGRLIPPA